MINLATSFKQKDTAHNTETLRRQRWYIAFREEQKRKEKLEAEAEDALSDFASAVILAQPEQIFEFNQKLDRYDEATVKALMENTEALERIEKQIQEQLKHAHVMEDGRKIFKSADGTWAVDQNGHKLDPQKDDLDLIPQTVVTAEDFLQTNDELKRLQKEHQEILDYQEKLDHARDRADKDNFSQDELDTLEQELETSMPQAVQEQLPDYKPEPQQSITMDMPKMPTISKPDTAMNFEPGM